MWALNGAIGDHTGSKWQRPKSKQRNTQCHLLSAGEMSAYWLITRRTDRGVLRVWGNTNDSIERAFRRKARAHKQLSHGKIPISLFPHLVSLINLWYICTNTLHLIQHKMYAMAIDNRKWNADRKTCIYTGLPFGSRTVGFNWFCEIAMQCTGDHNT